MGHRKLKKFAEVAGFSNVFQPHTIFPTDKPFHLKGAWNRDYFGNNNPITLELGCGKGEYTVGLAMRYPNRNFIGMDIKGARLWTGAKTATENNIKNIAFIRNRIDFIENYFAENEISEIWIPFPDPYPRKEQKRLVSPSFIKHYRNSAVPGARIHLKTDNKPLYEYGLSQVYIQENKLIASTDDLYNNIGKIDVETYQLLTGIQTYYEKTFLNAGKKICYLEFCI